MEHIAEIVTNPIGAAVTVTGILAVTGTTLYLANKFGAIDLGFKDKDGNIIFARFNQPINANYDDVIIDMA